MDLTSLMSIMLEIYRRDIIVLLIGKLVLLTGLFLACFSPKNRPLVDSSQMTNLILTPEEKTHRARP